MATEFTFPIETVGLGMACDEGGCDGEFFPTDAPMRLTSPPQFQHRCDKCGREDWFQKKYPTTRTTKYRPVAD